jgi:hypothetical protein
MPRYYFHLKTDSGLIADEEGLDLDLRKSEVKEIRAVVQDVLSEPQWRQLVSSKCEFHISDARGRTVLFARCKRERMRRARKDPSRAAA